MKLQPRFLFRPVPLIQSDEGLGESGKSKKTQNFEMAFVSGREVVLSQLSAEPDLGGFWLSTLAAAC